MVKYYDTHLDKAFAALSDPTRRAIVARLAEGDACVTSLAEPFGMSLPAVSKHLRVLERAGFLKRTKEGRVHRLHLQAKPLQSAMEWINHYQKFWTQQLDSLDDYLKQMDNEKQE